MKTFMSDPFFNFAEGTFLKNIKEFACGAVKNVAIFACGALKNVNIFACGALKIRKNFRLRRAKTITYFVLRGMGRGGVPSAPPKNFIECPPAKKSF